MEHILEVICCGVLLGGWTHMWLIWSFGGDVRSWLVAALFCRKWRSGKSRKDIAIMSGSSLEKWLISSEAPLMVCQLLTCYKCYTAHVAAVGASLIYASQDIKIAEIPLIWTLGATIGYRLYATEQRTN